MIRRLMRRNERALYRRKCDLCGEERISMFGASSPYRVYCKDCWKSDKWDALEYGREYDFSKPFFAQWLELLNAVPRQGIIQQGNVVDSEYINRSSDARGCYLIYGSTRNEFCRYGTWFIDSKDSSDCYNLQKSERCYECADCINSYQLAFSRECDSCSDSWFLLNCRNCQNCFGCVNLRNKQYAIFNKEYSKEEYFRKLKEMNLGSAAVLENTKARFAGHARDYIVPWAVIQHSDRSDGNWIQYSKNVRRSFNCRAVEDAKYCLSLFEVHDAMDYANWGHGSELIYESMNVGVQSSNCRFLNECWEQMMDAEYSMNCEHSQHIFGCVGITHKQYCILNKQYSKEEYEALVPKIREHINAMPYADRAGRVYRYGEFFPPELAVFGYNETLAQEFFPLAKEEALARGYAWRDPEEKSYDITLSAEDMPDHIRDAGDDILSKIIGCAHKGACKEQCSVAFRILPQELEMHRNASIPLPRLCPNCRHFSRIAQRNPLKLWHRTCTCAGVKSENAVYANTASHFHGGDRCPNEFETSYAPERPEVVYCEQCYNAEVL